MEPSCCQQIIVSESCIQHKPEYSKSPGVFELQILKHGEEDYERNTVPKGQRGG